MIMMSRGDIRLRQLSMTDKTSLAALANNKNVWDNLRGYMPYPYHEKDAVTFIRFTANENPPLNLGIEYRDELCGVIGLTPQHDVYKLSAEMGYWIGEPFWKRGIATTAVGLMTDYGFHRLNFIRIYAGVFEYNAASMRVLEKNGFRLEGISRCSILKNGRIWDEHRYANIRADHSPDPTRHFLP